VNGGYFVQPTIYYDVPQTHSMWSDELFGPALTICTFQTAGETLALAGDSDYALVATIVSEDLIRAERFAEAIDGGHVWINTPQIIFPNTAWGGFKASGNGRELGPWGLSAYIGVKHITTYTGRQ